MRLVKQPKDTYLCQACCIAMVVGCSLDEVLSKSKLHKALDGSGKEYLTNKESIRFLLDYNMCLGALVQFNPMITLEDKPEVAFAGLEKVDAIVGVRSKRLENAQHAVVWNASEQVVLDPREDTPQQLSSYEVYEWWPVVKLEQDYI